MTEDDKKLITEWLGWCWIPIKPNPYRSDGIVEGKNPSFSPDDWTTLGLCKEKIVTDGKWKNFYIWARHQFCKDFVTVCSRDDMEANFNCWLIQPINFFPLVAAWLREEGT